jgi:hypothetical protein
MLNRTHALESGPTLHAEPPCPPDRARGFGRVVELLLIPFLLIGYHVAVTVLKALGHGTRDDE